MFDPRTTRYDFALVDHEPRVVTWLVSWKYLWLLQLLKSQRPPREVQMAPIPHDPKEQFRIEEQCTHLGNARSEGGRQQSKVFWASAVLIIVTTIQWVMALVYSVLLGRNLWSSARPYIEMKKAADKTFSVASAMSQGCIDWLSTNSINNYPFPDLNIAPIIMATVTAVRDLHIRPG